MSRKKIRSVAAMATVLTLVAVLADHAFGHCDTLSGPVAVAARQALETGNFQTIQIWAGAEQEKELRERFDQSLQVRKLGGQARDMADLYFIETAVRLHRAAEGMAYTGLKPAEEHPDIHAAEHALETGDVKPVLDLLVSHLRTQLTTWFEKAHQARQNKDRSVQGGREYVDAYVKYVVFVHGLHEAIQAGPEHGVHE